MTWLWKLERKFGRYAIHHLVKYLTIANAAALIVLFVLSRTAPEAAAWLYNTLALIPSRLLQGEVWRLFTFVLLPENLDPLWGALTLYFFYFIGTSLENSWGAFKFNVYYLIGVVGTILGAVLVALLSPSFASTTALYLNLSLLLAFATLFPDHQIMLFFFIPVKMKWLGLVYAAFVLWTVVSSLLFGNWGMAVAPVVSLLNYLLFFGRDLLKVVHLRRRVSNNRRKFFDEINRANLEREQRQKHDSNIRRF